MNPKNNNQCVLHLLSQFGDDWQTQDEWGNGYKVIYCLQNFYGCALSQFCPTATLMTKFRPHIYTGPVVNRLIYKWCIRISVNPASQDSFVSWTPEHLWLLVWPNQYSIQKYKSKRGDMGFFFTWPTQEFFQDVTSLMMSAVRQKNDMSFCGQVRLPSGHD